MKRITALLTLVLVSVIVPAVPASAQDLCATTGFCGQGIPTAPSRTAVPVVPPPSYQAPAYVPAYQPAPTLPSYSNPGVTSSYVYAMARQRNEPLSPPSPAWSGVWNGLSRPEQEAVIGKESGRPYSQREFNSANGDLQEHQKRVERTRNAQRRDPGSGHYGYSTSQYAVAAASGVTVGAILWWGGKFFSPLCGPAAPACLVIL